MPAHHRDHAPIHISFPQLQGDIGTVFQKYFEMLPGLGRRAVLAEDAVPKRMPGALCQLLCPSERGALGQCEQPAPPPEAAADQRPLRRPGTDQRIRKQRRG